MPLGIALILIFVLYLVDKHNLWRVAAKVLVGLIIISGLAYGALWGYASYDDYRTNQQQEAEARKEKPYWDCLARNTQFSNAATECTTNSNVTLHPAPVVNPVEVPAPVKHKLVVQPPSMPPDAPPETENLGTLFIFYPPQTEWARNAPACWLYVHPLGSTYMACGETQPEPPSLTQVFSAPVILDRIAKMDKKSRMEFHPDTTMFLACSVHREDNGDLHCTLAAPAVDTK